MHITDSAVDVGLDRGDGVCMYFDETTRLCLIYDRRPIICNVDMFYQKYLCGVFTQEEFYEINYKSCKKIKEKYRR